MTEPRMTAPGERPPATGEVMAVFINLTPEAKLRTFSWHVADVLTALDHITREPTEKSLEDAPPHYDNAAASAWVAGYNSAVDDIGRRATPGAPPKETDE